jgi:hypothetical protein
MFVGDGAQRKVLEDAVARHRLTNVELHPYQPRAMLGDLLGVADIYLLSLKPELEGLIVSKFHWIAPR